MARGDGLPSRRILVRRYFEVITIPNPLLIPNRMISDKHIEAILTIHQAVFFSMFHYHNVVPGLPPNAARSRAARSIPKVNRRRLASRVLNPA